MRYSLFASIGFDNRLLNISDSNCTSFLLSYLSRQHTLLSDLSATKVNDYDEIKFALEHRFQPTSCP